MKCKIGVDKPQPLLYNKIIKRKELIKNADKESQQKRKKRIQQTE